LYPKQFVYVQELNITELSNQVLDLKSRLYEATEKLAAVEEQLSAAKDVIAFAAMDKSNLVSRCHGDDNNNDGNNLLLSKLAVSCWPPCTLFLLFCRPTN
jgi:hypothetical protein